MRSTVPTRDLGWGISANTCTAIDVDVDGVTDLHERRRDNRLLPAGVELIHFGGLN